MRAYRQPNTDLSTEEWLAGQTQPHATTAATASPAPEPVYAQRPARAEDDGYSESRQRELSGGPNWGAGFFGWLVAVSLAVVLAGFVAAGVTALGMNDQVLSTDAGRPGIVVIATTATLFGSLLVAYYAGGYVAGRMSRFDGGKQGVAVWLTGLLLGGIVVGLGLLAGSRYDTFDGVDLPTMPVPTEASALSGVITGVATLMATLLMAIAGGKVGCRYHRKVDEAAYL